MCGAVLDRVIWLGALVAILLVSRGQGVLAWDGICAAVARSGWQMSYLFMCEDGWGVWRLGC